MTAVSPVVATALAWIFAWGAGGSRSLRVEVGALAMVLLITGVAWRKFPPSLKGRALLSGFYLWALWFYLAIERLTPAGGILPYDEILLLADHAFFSSTPSLWWSPEGLVLEALSACYLGYHVYLHGALAWALLNETRCRTLAAPLFTTFGFGYLLYLLVPALGPKSLDLYGAPLEGGLLFRTCEAFVAAGSSVFDAFPSMHTAITLTLLGHDFRHHRKRFFWVLIPASGLIFSTIFLRYHYAVDVLAGALIAGCSLGVAALHRSKLDQAEAADSQSSVAADPPTTRSPRA